MSSRSKKTYFNAVTQIISVFVQSIFALVVTRFVISEIGSDYNGISSTAGQILTLLTLIEGGFTLASLVKLYKPYNQKDYETMNKYLSVSNSKFKIIGIGYLVVGVLISIIYAFFVNSSAQYYEIALIFILSVVSSAFSVFYVSKFRLLYQVSQDEYIVYIIQIIFYCIMYSLELVAVIIFKNIIIAKLVVMLCQILQCLVIGIVAKKRYKEYKYNLKIDDLKIEGTRDVFVSKFCGLIYSSAPFFFISSFVGTIYTSVYSIYMAVIGVISNVINAFLLAPRNALGQIVNDGDSDCSKIKNIFNEYDFVSALFVAILGSTTFALIMPFVKLYTQNITDVNYVDLLMAVLIIGNMVLQMIHIPSGNFIEVSAKFKFIKISQSLTAIVILIGSLIGAVFWGIYGILCAKLISSFILCLFEMIYARKILLKSSFVEFIKVVLPSISISICMSVLEFILFENYITTIPLFICFGFMFVIGNSLVLLFVNYFINKKYFLNCFNRIKSIIKR